MARSRYKLGQFIKTTDTEEQASVSGVIEGVVEREDGYSYEIAGVEEEVEEGLIAAVYRPVTPRQPKLKNGEKTSKRKTTKSAAQAA